MGSECPSERTAYGVISNSGTPWSEMSNAGGFCVSQVEQVVLGCLVPQVREGTPSPATPQGPLETQVHRGTMEAQVYTPTPHRLLRNSRGPLFLASFFVLFSPRLV